MAKQMIKWSATRINVANYCRMRYWLTYLDPSKPKELRLSAYVRGSLFHALVENFWDRLGSEGEIKRNKKGQVTSKKKYSTSEEFSKYAKGKWQSIIIADETLRRKYGEEQNPAKKAKMENDLIYWRDGNERYQIKGLLPRTCIPLFDYLNNEGPPKAAEKKFDFILGNRRFNGFIDEVRVREGRVVIRDYKTGKPWVGDMKSEFDPQLTLYNIGLCSLCFSDREFAKSLGLDDRVVDTYMGNPDFIDPNFDVEFFMIDALGVPKDNPKIKTMPSVLVGSKRKNEHFYELVKMTDGIQKDIAMGNIFPERGRKCDSCSMKFACAKKLDEANSGEIFGKGGQQYFDFVAPSFLQKKEIEKKKRLRDFDRDPQTGALIDDDGSTLFNFRKKGMFQE